ncbi:hypothetical protein CWI39_0274p0040 [Hamiltosporidium magnivora]|uniref:DUF2415 domain-containing protein n=1 Tax=Hamiltosporidium magnivora TaxID=148818 RepID=A0A4Q9LIW0_9MICR|nr:hypothetical protein CWI39_0274p0040 [Hamiltosporidium magnivora]
MNKLQPTIKILETTYFSSDISKNDKFVVFTDSYHNISILNTQTLQHHKIITDTPTITSYSNTYVKYYPSGNTLCSTTDTHNGLRLYDISTSKNIFNYKKDTLFTHCYSINNTLAATTPSGIKFYDLKYRYSNMFIPIKEVTCIEWKGLYLYVGTDSGIYKYDVRNQQAIEKIDLNENNIREFDISNIKIKNSNISSNINTDMKVTDILSSTSYDFCTLKINNKNYIKLLNTSIIKECISNKMYKIQDIQFIIAMYCNSLIKLYSYTSELEIKFKDIKSIKGIEYCRSRNFLYIFTDTEMYYYEIDKYIDMKRLAYRDV